MRETLVFRSSRSFTTSARSSSVGCAPSSRTRPRGRGPAATEAPPSLTDQLAEETTEEVSKQLQYESLVETHRYSPADAQRIIEETMSQGKHVRLLTSRNPDSPAFFNVEYIPGMLQVALNMDHPVYSDLIAVLDGDIDGASREELAGRLTSAANAFKLLLISWARFEDEQPEKPRERAKRMRQDWGRLASEFLGASDADDEDDE
jgi:hypothetical protein